MKNVVCKLVPGHFSFQRIPCKKGICGGRHADLDKF